MKILCKLWLATVFFLWAIAANAQSADNTDYNIWNVNPNDTAYVYGKVANVRLEPNLSATIQDSLVCGSMLIIKSVEQNLDVVKGIYAPWAKVAYSVNDIERQGYIWVGLLSLGAYENSEAKFIYGIDRIVAALPDDEGYAAPIWLLKVKALSNNGNLMDEYEWQINSPEIAATGGKLLGDQGLKNTTDVVRLHFGGEACGVPLNYFYFGWSGKKFLLLPGKMEVGDAGVFYHSETFLFPKEQGGQPDKIIKLTEESEATERMDKNGEPIFKTTKSRIVYNWDGQRATKIK